MFTQQRFLNFSIVLVAKLFTAVSDTVLGLDLQRLLRCFFFKQEVQVLLKLVHLVSLTFYRFSSCCLKVFSLT